MFWNSLCGSVLPHRAGRHRSKGRMLSIVVFQSVVILKLSFVREIVALAVLRIVDSFDALSLNVKREKN